MASYSPWKSIRKSPKSDSVVSMRPRKPKFCVRVPLYHWRFLVTIGMQYLHMYWFLRWFPFKGNENQYSFLSQYSIPAVSKNFRGLIETVWTDPAVSLRPHDSIPKSHWVRGNRSHGLIETAEILTKIFMSDPVVSLRMRDSNRRSHWDHGNRHEKLCGSGQHFLNF
jgi:hypothetical protein